MANIDRIEGKIRFFRNSLLAIISGLVWSIYAILENKVGSEIFIFIRVKTLEIEQEVLIDKLEKK